MAAMTTALTEFADSGNSRTYSLVNHTALKPQLVIQKRRVPSNGQVVAESDITVLSATVDSDGTTLAQKVAFEARVRFPVSGAQADIDAMLAVFRDIIAGDEFANTVDTQEWLK